MFCGQRKRRSRLNMHMRRMREYNAHYETQGYYNELNNIPGENYSYSDLYHNKVMAEKRCANRIRHLIVKANHKDDKYNSIILWIIFIILCLCGLVKPYYPFFL